jgi:heptosyltransferase I
VQHIQKHWPETKITWVIGKIEAQLIRALLPDVELIVFDKKHGRVAFTQLRQQLRGRHFDALLHLQANFRANLVSLCIPAKKKIGFGRERARELQWLFTNIKAPIGSGIHVAEGFMDFAVALGLPAAKPTWNVSAPQENLDWAKQYKDERPLFILCPSASKAERNWTTEGYAAILSYAHQNGFKTALIGSPAANEVELARKIMALTPHVELNLVGKTNLVQLFALLQQAQIVVAPDTGPAHMATLAGTPVIGLYAAQTPLRTGPYNDLDKVVSVYDEALLAETGKTVAQVSWRTRVKAKDAMHRITVEKVLTQLSPLLSNIRD